MKQKLISLNIVMLLASLFFSGCRKEIKETPVIDENNLRAREQDKKSGCLLTHLDYGTGVTLDFKYNNKGLASEVLLSFSDASFERHQIFYDRKGRIVNTRITSSDLSVINYTFFHTGNNITRATGYFEGTNELWRDIFYSYNRKGQMKALDDVVQDVHVKYFYNNQGYNTHGEFYLGTDLFFSYDYEFNTPNRNPFLAVPGVPFGFWDFLIPLWDKRWEDYDRFTIYDNGVPAVVLETDPAQTSIVTGPHHYLRSATKFDMISESFYTESMIYQNCDDRDDDRSTHFPNSKKATGMSGMTRMKKIINGHSKNIKQELADFKRQYSNQLKPVTQK